MFDVKDLRTMGLLSSDDWFLITGARDEEEQQLSERQCLRCYGAKVFMEIKDLVLELRREGLAISADKVYAIACAMEWQWQQQSRFPYDLSQWRTPFDPHHLPICVRNVVVHTYLPWRTLDDMQALLDRHSGAHLRRQLAAMGQEVGDETFVAMLRDVRDQPIVVRLCVICGKPVRTTLDQFKATDDKFHFVPRTGEVWSGNLFTPHRRCPECRGQRLSARDGDRSAVHGRGHARRRNFACLRDKLQVREALEAMPVAAAAPAPAEPEPEPTSAPLPEWTTINVPAEPNEA